MDASCRVQNGTQEAASDMGPLRALRTGQANQPEHHAFGKRSFQNGELGVEIDRTGLVGTGRVTASPALAWIVIPTRANGHDDLGQGFGWDQGVLALVFGIVDRKSTRLNSSH